MPQQPTSSTDSTFNTAKLEGGRINHYDLCSQNGPGAYPKDKFKHIGDGVIHSIDGVIQKCEKKYSFFSKRF